MYLLLNMLIFHCHVRFQGGNPFLNCFFYGKFMTKISRKNIDSKIHVCLVSSPEVCVENPCHHLDRNIWKRFGDPTSIIKDRWLPCQQDPQHFSILLQGSFAWGVLCGWGFFGVSLEFRLKKMTLYGGLPR